MNVYKGFAKNRILAEITTPFSFISGDIILLKVNFNVFSKVDVTFVPVCLSLTVKAPDVAKASFNTESNVKSSILQT